MNGNPFRKQAPPPIQMEGNTASAQDKHEQYAARDPPPPPETIRTKKTVRISSPPRSPISPPHPSSAAAANNYDGSSSSSSSSSRSYRQAQSHHDTPSTPYASKFPSHEEDEDEDTDEVNKEDPFEKEQSSGDEGTSTDTEQKMPETVIATTKSPHTVVPANPFSRTLATLEEPLRSSMRKGRTEELAEATPIERSVPRASLDVDAFKNLLMTGKVTSATPLKSSMSSKPQNFTLADNSSSTDTSSISRQSLFEPMQEGPVESPRTSYERSLSEDEEERKATLKERRKSAIPPPPPKHRYGKAVTPRGPQVVSFSDFSTSFNDPSDSSLPITVSSPPRSPIESRPRRDSDLNKPLPPRPSSRDSASMDKDLAAPKRISLDASLPDPMEPSSPQRLPPVPPLARRSSVMRQNLDSYTRTRSNTQNSNVSQQGEVTSLRSLSDNISESTSSAQKIAPPPPPARRSGPSHLSQNNSASASEEGLTLSRSSSLKSPPPPPSRNRSLSALSSPLTSNPNPGVMSPPPRPPPRRSSSRSSMEIHPSPAGSRRTSGELKRSSVDVERRPSIASIVRENPITEESTRGEYDLPPEEYRQKERDDGGQDVQKLKQSESDVLAEMEAFQREIDELAQLAARKSR